MRSIELFIFAQFTQVPNYSYFYYWCCCCCRCCYYCY